MSPPGVSCIVCSYNGAAPERLPSTLRSLLNQQVGNGLHWEIIVVDNNSTDGTGQVAEEILSTQSAVCYRVIVEKQQGLTYARRAGINISAHPVIVFVDDDMRLDENFVKLASEIMSANPNAGLCGSKGVAVINGPVPTWFERYAPYFAIGLSMDAEGDVTERRIAQNGAGLVLSRAFLESVFAKGFTPVLAGRAGESMLGAEDLELSYVCRLSGWRVLADSRLIYEHFLPQTRLTEKYLKNLFRAFGHESVFLDAYRFVESGRDGGVMQTLRAMWICKLLGELARLLVAAAQHLAAPSQLDATIRFERNLGRVQGLLSIAATYRQRICAVQQAKWLRS